MVSLRGRLLQLWRPVVCALVLCAPVLRAEGAPEPLKLREEHRSLFADTKAVFHVEIPAALAGQRVIWAHTSTDGRVFTRGEAAVAEGAAKLELQLPPVKPGLVLETVLTCSILAPDGRQALAAVQTRLHLFPRDPFVDRQEWLKKLKITLYDPKEKTAAALKAAGVPHDLIANSAALTELREGLLLIGEGISLREERGLAEALVAAAAGGTPVICLAPVDGAFPLAGETFKQAGSFGLQRSTIITQLDKRLDAEAWLGGHKVVASRLALRGEGAAVTAEVDPAQGDWPWLDIPFARTPGRLVVCGFGLIEAWDAGPAPRFLLARILEHCDPKSSRPLPESEGNKP